MYFLILLAYLRILRNPLATGHFGFDLKGTGFTGCGIAQSEGLCNKGTALAGPIKPIK
jgi:hypothetical protein